MLMGLDDLHTYFVTPGRVRPDAMGAVKAMQQATVNLFADMGVQPAALQSDLRRAEPSTDRTGPLAKILSPQDGTIAAGALTITGVASDAEGVVAAVEISVDGGATWHPASGTDTWSYQWQTPADFEQATISVRADRHATKLHLSCGILHAIARRVQADTSSANGSRL